MSNLFEFLFFKTKSIFTFSNFKLYFQVLFSILEMVSLMLFQSMKAMPFHMQSIEWTLQVET